MRSAPVWGALFAGVLWLAGCADGPPITGVGGTIKFKGEPVAAGIVRFESVDKGFAAEASLGADGAYRLRSQYGEGIPLGKYRVTVLPPPPPEKRPGEPTPPAPESSIPAPYRDAATSPLTADVVAGAQAFDFELKE